MSPAKLDPKLQPSIHALKNIYDFGEKFHDYHFQMAEKYLVKVIKPNIAAELFDDLRYVIYTTRKTTFSELPPTSSAIKGHLL